MSRRMRVVSAILLAAILVLAAVLAPAPAAQAYGNTAIYQIGLSFNCNNPGFCGSNLGGFWGWVEFDQGGTGDATLSECQHMIGGRGGGAQALHIDVRGWTIAPGTAGEHTFFVTSEVDTLTGHTGGPPVTVTIDNEMSDTGIPADPGHYDASSIFGMTPPPGVAIQIQVVEIPNRQ